MKRDQKKPAPSTSLQKYGGFDLDEAEKDEKELKSSGGSAGFLKLEVGKTRIRWVPPPPGKKWRRATHVHYVDIPGAGRTSFVCPRLEAKQPCPVCTEAQRLLSRGNDIDEKKGKKLLPQRRCYAVVVNREDSHTPLIFAFGRTIEEQLIALRKDEDEGGDFVNPVDGMDLIIIRKGTTQFDTRYTVRPGKRGEPLLADAAEMDELIEAQPSVDKWCRVPSLEEIKAILRGEDPREAREAAKAPPARTEDSDDDDDLPPPKPRARARVEDDMDDVDDD